MIKMLEKVLSVRKMISGGPGNVAFMRHTRSMGGGGVSFDVDGCLRAWRCDI